MDLQLLLTVPHAGEKVPSTVPWLDGLSVPHLMRDIDRYVDQFYEPFAVAKSLPFFKTQWHRYVVDLNRFPTDFDAQAVEGAELAAGHHPKGLHWCITTFGEPLITAPMTKELHVSLVKDHYEPFHNQVKAFRKEKRQFGEILHLDCHSMPSQGTALHADPGCDRPDIVISDYKGTTSSKDFVDLVLEAYQEVGFEVGYNFPYVGGGVTRMYGEPEQGFHNIQIELNRKLYMNEETKEKAEPLFSETQRRIHKALEFLILRLKEKGYLE